jgi:hypothetical protein
MIRICYTSLVGTRWADPAVNKEADDGSLGLTRRVGVLVDWCQAGILFLKWVAIQGVATSKRETRRHASPL